MSSMNCDNEEELDELRTAADSSLPWELSAEDVRARPKKPKKRADFAPVAAALILVVFAAYLAAWLFAPAGAQCRSEAERAGAYAESIGTEADLLSCSDYVLVHGDGPPSVTGYVYHYADGLQVWCPAVGACAETYTERGPR